MRDSSLTALSYNSTATAVYIVHKHTTNNIIGLSIMPLCTSDESSSKSPRINHTFNTW